MGYTLKIGQAITYADPETGSNRLDCEKVYLKEAPAFGEITDHTNVRMPSYSTWEDFANEVGLYGFFFDPDHGLLNGPDGVSVLNSTHKAVIDQVCAEYLEKHPLIFSAKDKSLSNEENYHFERLRWLKFWTDWALEHCASPVFINEQ